MAVERAAGGSSLIDVLDRVLDKGIVIDAWVRVSLVGIDLITVEARVVVASIDTYLKYSEAVGQSVPVARPALESRPYDDLVAENQALRAELERGRVPRRRPRRAARHDSPPRAARVMIDGDGPGVRGSGGALDGVSRSKAGAARRSAALHRPPPRPRRARRSGCSRTRALSARSSPRPITCAAR